MTDLENGAEAAEDAGAETAEDSTDAKMFSGIIKKFRPKSEKKMEVDAEPEVTKTSFRYTMNYSSIGKCVIINNIEFESHTGLQPRPRAEEDAAGLKQTFSDLGFQIQVFTNLPKDDMYHMLGNVASEDHSQKACFVCVLLSYGEDGIIFGTDGGIETKTLTSLFRGDKCKTLVGKPKLFFIQACTEAEDPNIEPDSSSSTEGGLTQRIPVEADFLYTYSIGPPIYGFWFVKSLCDMLNQYGKKLELIQILTRVNHKVALEFKSSDVLDTCPENRVSCIVSMLTKQLYFGCWKSIS